MSSRKWRPFCLSLNVLSDGYLFQLYPISVMSYRADMSWHLKHWGWDKMASILQTTFSNAFSPMKTFIFGIKFYWSLFLRVQSTICHYTEEATSHYVNQRWHGLVTHVYTTWPHWVNTLRLRQSGRHFADNIYKCNFFNENVSISNSNFTYVCF